MTLIDAVLLFLAAAVAGGINSVAGGGSVLSFPALVFTGVAPIPANATSTIALWPGSVASVGAYRDRMPSDRRLMIPLVLISALGGILGALLLLKTPEQTFLDVIPYLFATATLLFAFGKRLTSGFAHLFKSEGRISVPLIAAASIAQLAIAVYGGFFGGGIGILMLAVFQMIHMEDIHAMNGLKTLLAAAINGVAVVTFILAGIVRWPQAAVMIAGAMLGGYGGAHYAQKVDHRVIRSAVIAVGSGMAIYFFWKY
jgi:uncharacterized membrane protein YfcA